MLRGKCRCDEMRGVWKGCVVVQERQWWVFSSDVSLERELKSNSGMSLIIPPVAPARYSTTLGAGVQLRFARD